MELISREDAMQAVRALKEVMLTNGEVINALYHVPTIESRPIGKWIVSKEDSNYNCSICGCNPRKSFRASSLEWIREINGCDMQYCPWCGADMRGEEV